MNTKLVSNKVYDSLQVPGFVDAIGSQGTILYANKYSGLVQRPMSLEMSAIFDSDLGSRGKNPWIQLSKKLDGLENGPWYMDTREGILYIHNRKFQGQPEHVYTYQGGNGEVLSVEFTTQKNSKSLSGGYHRSIEPATKEIHTDTTIPNSTSLPEQPEQPGDEVVHSVIYDRIPKNVGGNPYSFSKKTPVVDAADRMKNKSGAQLTEDYHNQVRNTYNSLTDHEKENMYKQWAATLPLEIKQKLVDAARLYRGDIKSFKAYVNKLIGGNSCVYQIKGIRIPRKQEYTLNRKKLHGIYWAVGGRTKDEAWKEAKYELARFKKSHPDAAYQLKVHKTQRKVGEVSYTYYYYTVEYVDTDYKYTYSLKIPGSRLFLDVLTRRGTMGILAKGKLPSNLQSIVSGNRMGRVTEKQTVIHLKLVGNPNLRNSQKIELRNLGKKYSGVYYIKSVSHTIESQEGYTCSLELVTNLVKDGSSTVEGNFSTSDKAIQNSLSSGYGKDLTPEKSVNNFNLTKSESEAYAAEKDPEKKEAIVNAISNRYYSGDKLGSAITIEQTVDASGKIERRYKVNPKYKPKARKKVEKDTMNELNQRVTNKSKKK